MNDNDFDKIFAQKFRNLPDKPTSQEDWNTLSGRLDQHNRNQRRWVLPLLLLLLGLLSGGNLFWWYQWHKASTSAASAQQSAITPSPTDTVIHRTVVYHYDTIYENITVLRKQYQYSDNTPQNTFSNRPSTPQATTPPSAVTTTALSTEKNSPASTTSVSRIADAYGIERTSDPLSLPTTAIADTLNKTASSIGSTPQPAIIRPIEQADSLASTPTSTGAEELPIQKQRTPLFLWARPRAGVVTGWNHSALTEKRNGIDWQAGIVADVEISKKIRLAGALQFQQAKLSAASTQSLEQDIETPIPGGDFQLKYWEIAQLSALTYSLQLNISLPDFKKIKPVIGLGGRATTIFPYEVEYEFRSQGSDLELDIEAEMNTQTRWQGALVSFGLERPITKNITVALEGFSLYNWDNPARLLNRQWGLTAKALYHF